MIRTFALALALLAATPAVAGSIAVANASFESFAPGTVQLSCNVGTCTYTDSVIAGWTGSGVRGQIQPGTDTGNFFFYNSIPDGLTAAYTVTGTLSQTVAAFAEAGATYTLSLLIGYRKDTTSDGRAELVIGDLSIAATGTPLNGSGNWSAFTATYTATAADTGAPISIRLLPGPGGQGSFDSIRLDAIGIASGAVPEPESWALLIFGFGLAGLAMRRRGPKPVAA